MKKMFVVLNVLIGFYGHPQSNAFPPSGNVGIGILNPSADLEIYNFDGESNLKVYTNQFNGIAKLELAGGVDSAGGNYSGWSIYHSNNHTRKDLYFRYRLEGSPEIVFTNDGHLGVGSSNPQAMLEVFDYSELADFKIYTNQHDGIAKLEIAGGVDEFGGKYSGWSIFHSYNKTGKDLHFRHGLNGDPSIIFTDDGNMGIGIISPGSWKLAVNGKIRAKEIKVETSGWSDFVFDEGYNLPKLDEVEKHIQEKGHLKDIPSAEEVSENGIFLGEMNAKLLQKIEELTLYVIEQNKRIEKLESKLENCNQP
ncbi:hypothetical protein HX109_10775 [Galbibacter sp. BG1]|uniref:hypothetical protein n=1 Tax=Galbibacter sp. BG1 TaxID=1170699 RepID=UPI0015BDF18F|nr:hypothetical protein [Galbibacter sp. BG1]QLE02013.1 hypothetical protein HX109_10775 [Galbibacter sp. BG1]